MKTTSPATVGVAKTQPPVETFHSTSPDEAGATGRARTKAVQRATKRSDPSMVASLRGPRRSSWPPAPPASSWPRLASFRGRSGRCAPSRCRPGCVSPWKWSSSGFSTETAAGLRARLLHRWKGGASKMVELNGIEHARPALVPSAKRAVRAGVGLGLASEAGGTPPAPPDVDGPRSRSARASLTFVRFGEAASKVVELNGIEPSTS